MEVKLRNLLLLLLLLLRHPQLQNRLNLPTLGLPCWEGNLVEAVVVDRKALREDRVGLAVKAMID